MKGQGKWGNTKLCETNSRPYIARIPRDTPNLGMAQKEQKQAGIEKSKLGFEEGTKTSKIGRKKGDEKQLVPVFITSPFAPFSRGIKKERK